MGVRESENEDGSATLRDMAGILFKRTLKEILRIGVYVECSMQGATRQRPRRQVNKGPINEFNEIVASHRYPHIYVDELNSWSGSP